MSAPALLPNSYWVLPGQLLAGEYPAAADSAASRERLARLLAAGVDCFVDLTEERELPPYDGLLPVSVEYHRKSIGDHGVPARPEQMLEILEVIERALGAGRCVYVHCHAGIGRTGMVIGCLLSERGMGGHEALEALNRAWQQSPRAQLWGSVPETEQQVKYVRTWVPRGAARAAPTEPTERTECTECTERTERTERTEPIEPTEPTESPEPAEVTRPADGPDRLAKRFIGALVGLAAGDALSAATQGRDAGSFAPVTAPLGGGPCGLPAGAWSDDTAMALCLAESLAARRSFDPRDQIERYVRWQREGHLSATGECAGITASTRRALARATWRRQIFPGSHEPRRLDPEPLSRVAPAVMLAFPSLEDGMRYAGDAARITCQSAAVVEACRVFAAMLHAALSDLPKAEVLTLRRALGDAEIASLRPRIRSLLQGRYRRKAAWQMRSGEGIFQALEAALWAFERTATFGEGALLAANLGGRSDVACAAYGQLAGAYYTVDAIPPGWVAGLARLDLIRSLAGELYRPAAR